MTSGSKKKKRKAAKKKKRKQLHNKNNCKGINIHSPPTTLQEADDLEPHSGPICNGGDHSGLVQEEIGCSSVGIVSESKSMEGSGIEGGEKKPETEEAVEVVKDLESVSIEHVEDAVEELGDGGDGIVEKTDSLEEGDSGKTADDPVEKVISSVSEEMHYIVEKIPISETVSRFVEVIPFEKVKESGVLESISKEIENGGISLDLPRAETSHETEESKEPDEKGSHLPIVPPVLKKSTWKSCCGLFE